MGSGGKSLGPTVARYDSRKQKNNIKDLKKPGGQSTRFEISFVLHHTCGGVGVTDITVAHVY